MPYLIFKLIHIFAVIIFIGNIVIGIFWKNHGDKSNDPKIIASTIQGIIKADKIFTMPSTALIVIAGFGTAGIGFYPVFETGWIILGLILVIISGAAFMIKVGPAQKKLLQISSTEPFDKEIYDTVSKEWHLWGTVAVAAPVIAVIMMVLKIPM
jgi:uncharacterized membrane protein